MNPKIKLQMIFQGLDFWSAVAVVAVLYCCVPSQMIPNTLAKDLYAIGMTVLSVIFSVFIASLAIIMSSGSDDFINFLEEEGQFTLIVWGFKITLIILFVALAISIALYSFTSFWIALKYDEQNIAWFAFFSFFATWSLLATLLSAISSISYSQYRIRFIRTKTSNTKE